MGADYVSELIKPSDETAVRLVVFTAALLTISARQNVLFEGGTIYMVPESILPIAVAEARAIADAVVAEAKRLNENEPLA